MSYSLELLGPSSPFPLTLASSMPALSITHAYEHDTQEPRKLTAVVKRWQIRGEYRMSTVGESAAITAYDALAAALESRSVQLSGWTLSRDSSPAITVKTRATGGVYEEVQVIGFSWDSHPRLFRTRMPFTLTLQATLKLSSAGIVRLQQNESYHYAESGLVTHTLEGQVETVSGTSAEAAARAQALSLPDSSHAYLTAGPEGVDVSILDEGDTKATFSCVVVQSGIEIPDDVGPSFSIQTAVSTADGKVTTVTTVTAVGIACEDEVDAAEPSGVVRKTRVVDPSRRFATATYVQEEAADTSNITNIVRAIVVDGGGQQVIFSPMSGGRDPIEHILARGPVTVTETISGTVIGVLAPGIFGFPQALPMRESRQERSFQPATRVVKGADPAGDHWFASLRRVYRAVKVDASVFDLAVADPSPDQPLDQIAQDDRAGVQRVRLGGDGGPNSARNPLGVALPSAPIVLQPFVGSTRPSAAGGGAQPGVSPLFDIRDYAPPASTSPFAAALQTLQVSPARLADPPRDNAFATPGQVL